MNAYCAICATSNHGVVVQNRPDRGHEMWEVECARCGHYLVDQLSGIAAIQQKGPPNLHLVSGVIRARTDAGQAPPEIRGEEDVRKLVDAAPTDRGMTDTMNRLLVALASKAEGLGYFQPIPFDKEKDYPLLFVKSANDANGFLVQARGLGYMDPRIDAHVLTVRGWERVEELRKTQPNSRQAFVAMWFDPQMEDAFEQGLKAGIEKSGYYSAMRMLSLEHNDRIDDRIVAEIRRSGLVVADLTGDRGGVYFEAGFAKGLGIPVIWSCKNDWFDKVHFDANHYNFIIWESLEDLAEKVHNRIVASGLLPIG